MHCYSYNSVHVRCVHTLYNLWIFQHITELKSLDIINTIHNTTCRPSAWTTWKILLSNNINILFTLPLRRVQICDQCVCMSVLIFVYSHISKIMCPKFTKFSVLLPVSVTLSSFENNAIHYVLLVLRMLSCFHFGRGTVLLCRCIQRQQIVHWGQSLLSPTALL